MSDPISIFQLTQSAKDPIVQFQKDTVGLMPMITWGTDSAQQRGKWELGGFIEKTDPNVEELRWQKGATFFLKFRKLNLSLDGPMHYLNLLKGATLDYVNGSFVLNVL